MVNQESDWADPSKIWRRTLPISDFFLKSSSWDFQPSQRVEATAPCASSITLADNGIFYSSGSCVCWPWPIVFYCLELMLWGFIVLYLPWCCFIAWCHSNPDDHRASRALRQTHARSPCADAAVQCCAWCLKIPHEHHPSQRLPSKPPLITFRHCLQELWSLVLQKPSCFWVIWSGGFHHLWWFLLAIAFFQSFV